MYVIIINFGNKSANGIAKVLNTLNVKYTIMCPNMIPYTEYTHIILSGGPKHVYLSDYYKMPTWVRESDKPVLGICYGMQLISCTLGGKVIKMNEYEGGVIPITEIINGNKFINQRWMNRYDRVAEIPKNFVITGITDKEHIASITDGSKWWAVQYHPESENALDYDTFIRFLSK
jgi:GMP synthase (glutamine-hydrolysing)